LVYKKQFFLISLAYFCFYSFITSFHAVSVLEKQSDCGQNAVELGIY